ncbi:MAG: HipA domain-containing protein, partial [Terracidiphilus sp.]
LKFSAVMEASGGLTIPAGGLGGSWIVKLPSARYQAVPENEFAMLELARRAGISVPENKLVEVNSIKGLPEQAHTVESKALAVKRFDRLPDGKPVHMEDFAQVFGEFPNNKYKFHSYANIAAVLWAEIGEDAVIEFVRRLVFSVIIAFPKSRLTRCAALLIRHEFRRARYGRSRSKRPSAPPTPGRRLNMRTPCPKSSRTQSASRFWVSQPA